MCACLYTHHTTPPPTPAPTGDPPHLTHSTVASAWYWLLLVWNCACNIFPGPFSSVSVLFPLCLVVFTASVVWQQWCWSVFCLTRVLLNPIYAPLRWVFISYHCDALSVEEPVIEIFIRCCREDAGEACALGRAFPCVHAWLPWDLLLRPLRYRQDGCI